MKAAVLRQTGIIQNIRENILIEDVPVPELLKDEILIRVNSASLNHRDLWISKGMYSKIKLPAVLGSDCSGTVTAVSTGVKEFKSGDDVILNPGLNWGDNENFQSSEFSILGMPDDGTFAEYVKISKSNVFRKPEHLTHEQAASVPLAGVTAYRALFRKLNLTSGDKLLITGAGGGVSAFVLLFALNAGAEVYVTSGNDLKIEKALSLGAKAGVNYNDPDWHNKIKLLSGDSLNTVFDSSGGDTFSKCMEIINPGGRIVSVGAGLGSVKDLSIHKLYWKQLKLYGSAMGSENDFSDMLNFINEKKIIPVIITTLALNDIHKGFQMMNDAQQSGKIIITL
ncbi:MAG: zinc-binding dehydrogenase [Ignavibacteria bacterium]|nr:zinc-binding dehydrogenase [Ignavibacteria bacterium]